MITVGLYTLGCKVSQYETEAIAEKFEQNGIEVRPFSEKNDIYVINTCTVTAESDRKSRQFIRRAIKENPDAVVAVVGCYSQRSADEVALIDGVDIIFGTDGKLAVVDAAISCLKNKRAGIPCEKNVSVTDVGRVGFEPMKITKASRTRAYVKIEDGCESKCTYCAISAARGRVRSKKADDVIAEVSSLFESGIGEVVLTGIETGSYGRDFCESYTLADLICELNFACPGGRIRLGSLSPELVGEAFVNKVFGVGILLPHFHLSMQSGSNSVLARMKRRYTRERALENIERLRRAFPEANFTTDLMVGFPGESEEDFLLTCDFVSKAEFLDAHVFVYSRRKDTPAYSYENQISEALKSERSARLIAHKNAVRDGLLSQAVSDGKEITVIAESVDKCGLLCAHSESFIEVKIPLENGGDKAQSMLGKWFKVAPVSHKNGVLYCEQI